MLSNHERYRLSAIEGVILSEKKLGNTHAQIFRLDTVMWLVEKLKEVNLELEQLNKIDKGIEVKNAK